MSVAELTRNGTAVTPMPIKTIDIALDEMGYPGWSVTMRTNPRASVYDTLVSVGDDWWQAFGQVVLAWNFTDEHGDRLPLPCDIASEKELDLPHGPLTYVFRRYIDAVVEATTIPKAPGGNSSTTASTSIDDRSSA